MNQVKGPDPGFTGPDNNELTLLLRGEIKPSNDVAEYYVQKMQEAMLVLDTEIKKIQKLKADYDQSNAGIKKLQAELGTYAKSLPHWQHEADEVEGPL